MQRPAREPGTTPRPRVVDIIADGLSLVLVRPWLLAVPVLLDLFYWLGFRIESDALIKSLIRLVNSTAVDNSEEIISSLNDLMSSDIVPTLGFFSPTMLNQSPRSDLFQLVEISTWTPTSPLLVLLITLGLFILSALITVIYGVPLGDAVLGRHRSIGTLVGAITRAWAKFLLLIGLALGSFIAIMIPLAIVAAFASIAGINLIPLITLAFSFLVIIGLVLMPFILDAISLFETGPIDSIRFSLATVRSGKPQAIGLVLALLLVMMGLPPMARPLLSELPGLLIAVVVYALIVTGFIAATMLFFVDRMRQWRPELIPLPTLAPLIDRTSQGESHL